MMRATLRTWFRRLHLAVALVFGCVFGLSGLTGCALAWMHELDAMLNPALFHAAPAPGPLAPAAVKRIVDRLAADPAYGRPSQLMLPARGGEVAVAWYRLPPAAGRGPFTLDRSRQVMVDPASLAVTGERVWGQAGLSRPLLMPTLFHLHRYLLAGDAGKTVVAVSGLALLFTSVAGFVLWWPRARLAAWRKAFSVAYRGSWPRLNYSFHRAAGAVVAPVLAMLGFSGCLFNQPQWITPVVASVAAVSAQDKPKRGAAGDVGVARAAQAASALFPAARVARIGLPATPGLPYEIRLRQPGEVRRGDGNTRVTVDAATGRVLRVRDPLHAPAGDAFIDWQFPLHTGEAFGTFGRVVISIAGLAPLAFLVTGLAIWRQRRKARAAAW
ncbi:hypothetical protein ASC93_00075 [Massilia sp. Root335]|nr:hypothetical protein ASC93_00075 [Massilia sp. Root335]